MTPSAAFPDPHVLLTEQGETEWLSALLQEAAAEREQTERRDAALAHALAASAQPQLGKPFRKLAVKKLRKAS